MQFETKIAVVLRDDLAVWQKTNVTAFATDEEGGVKRSWPWRRVLTG
jgi:hypothetical protein